MTNTQEQGIEDALTEQDIKMLWKLRDGQLPELAYNAQAKVLDVSLDSAKLNEFYEKGILSGRAVWLETDLDDRKLQVKKYGLTSDEFLGIPREVIVAHVNSMGRANTWANRRWRDRSDNFFGDGFNGPDYSVKQYVREDRKEPSWKIIGDRIVPSEIVLCLTNAAARKHFSQDLQKAKESVAELETRVKGVVGKTVVAKDLPFDKCEINGQWNEPYSKTCPVFAPLWAHNLKISPDKTFSASLYHSEDNYHIKKDDERNGVFGKITFSPLLSNGVPANAEALQRYSAFLGGQRK